jgi:hypothetical protein
MVLIPRLLVRWAATLAPYSFDLSFGLLPQSLHALFVHRSTAPPPAHWKTGLPS